MANTKVMHCGHCGRQTVFQVRAEGTQHGAVLPKNPAGIDYDGMTITTWRVQECELCFQPTLVQETVEYWFEHADYWAAEVQSAEATVLYPEVKKRAPLTHLPKAIEKEYKDTLKVQEISLAACAVLARRTLEAIFAYEKAEGKTLMEKVNNLIKSDRIPPLLADMAHLGRKIGNLGAHFAEENVTEEDVTAMLDFVEAILEYLYVAPAKVATVKARFTKVP